MGDDAAAAAAAKKKEEDAARFLRIKIEMADAQAKAKLVQMDLDQKQRDLMKKAIDEGFASRLSECVVLGDDDDGQSSHIAAILSSSNNSLPLANSGNPPSTSVDELAKILGSQRLKSSIPKDDDRFAGAADSAAAYARFRSKFTSEVLEVNGVTDDERFIALQERTSGEAGKTVANFVYESDKSQALKKALEELDFFYGSKLAKAESHLDKVLEGKEIQAHSVEQVK